MEHVSSHLRCGGFYTKFQLQLRAAGQGVYTMMPARRLPFLQQICRFSSGTLWAISGQLPSTSQTGQRAVLKLICILACANLDRFFIVPGKDEEAAYSHGEA